MLDCSCELWLLDTTTDIAPAIPRSNPITFNLENCSNPTTTDKTSTSSGVVVLIIEPSIGDVWESPNIIHSLRVIPIRSAAPNSFNRSAGSTLSVFSHIIGINDQIAATTNEAVTIAIGEMYVPSTRLYRG